MKSLQNNFPQKSQLNGGAQKQSETNVPAGKNVDAEYSILRAEILQYMEEYQNLRNMMYVGTVAILGINTAASFSVYLYLMPLIIIMPSYILFYDYWKSVSVASAYIQLFLEGGVACEGASHHRWETNHSEFGRQVKLKENGKPDPKRKLDLRWAGMNCHHIPYFLCAILCFVLYGLSVAAMAMNAGNELGTAAAQDINICAAAILGFVLFLVCAAVFYLFRSPDFELIEAVWKRVLAEEQQQ